MEDRRQPQLRGDLAYGALILEAKREQQTIRGIELAQRPAQRVAQLSAAQVGVGRALGRSR